MKNKVTQEEKARWMQEFKDGKSIYQIAKENKKAYRVIQRAVGQTPAKGEKIAAKPEIAKPEVAKPVTPPQVTK